MYDHDSEPSDMLPSLEEKSNQFSQTSTLKEPALSQLRDQIKKVMIPLLIKTFQLKLELSQALSLPSRLQSQKNQRSPDQITQQLKTLDADLKVLLLWCQSCRSQIHKALAVPEEEQKSTIAASSSEANPAVAKSFNEAVSSQTSFFQQQASQDKGATPPPKNWWKKWLG